VLPPNELEIPSASPEGAPPLQRALHLADVRNYDRATAIRVASESSLSVQQATRGYTTGKNTYEFDTVFSPSSTNPQSTRI